MGAGLPPLRLGIVGFPLGHSLSPLLHRRLGALAGREVIYEPYPVERVADLGARLEALRADGVRGVNVTIPHKVAAHALCRRLSESARAVGAVNTLMLSGDAASGFFGDDTDLDGVAGALADAGVAVAGRRALVLGAGGAARAAALHLARSGARVRVAARRVEAARALAGLAGATSAGRIEAVDWDARAAAAVEADVIVHATPIGMGSGPAGASPLPPGALRAGQAVLDMVYRPLDTPLLQAARAAGATPIDGLGMLIHQGVAAFARFADPSPPLALRGDDLARLRAALLDSLTREPGEPPRCGSRGQGV